MISESNKWGIMLVSRNNPDMVNEWALNNPRLTSYAINIDESEDDEVREKISDICQSHDIRYEAATESGMMNNISQYSRSLGCEWMLYMHHDAYYIDDNIVETIDGIVCRNASRDYGVIGFNILHGPKQIKAYKNGKLRFGTIARSVLEYGDGYYRPEYYNRAYRAKFDLSKPFAVESPMWTTTLIYLPKYFNVIEPDDNFMFFHAWDDIAFQYMNNNIYNICIPYVYFAHDQSLKKKYKLSVNSPHGKKSDIIKNYGSDAKDHLDYWYKKWGFAWSLDKGFFIYDFIRKTRLLRNVCGYVENVIFKSNPELFRTQSVKTFEKAKYRYKDTLLSKFFKHNPSHGPLKVLEQ